MDIFAHSLWTNALARSGNAVALKKNKKLRINVAWATFWGIFPDLFAFTIPFVVGIYRMATDSGMNFFSGPHDGGAFGIAHYLYQYSHSLVIWIVVFAVAWILSKRPRLELLGWALHIFIDIPSHAIGFFPTPFLFPISNYHFPYGTSWAGKWYMIINYSLLLLVWGYVLIKKVIHR